MRACGGSAVLFYMVYMWLKRSSTGILGTSDDQRIGRPLGVTDKFHIEKILWKLRVKKCVKHVLS